MQMLNVLKRLSELDAGKSNVKNPMVDMPVQSIAEGANGELPQLPELNDLSTLQALSGVKKIDECGPMGMMGGMGGMGGMPAGQPASFSINATASSGDEVASMLTQIMTLAGAKPLGNADIGGDAGPDLHPEPGSAPATKDTTPGSEGEVMRGMMDKMNDTNPEDEGFGDAATGGEAEAGTAEPIQNAADEVRDMADELAGADKEELGLESYDNTPNSPFNVGNTDTNARAYQPNTGSAAGRGMANNPRAMTAEQVEQQLYADYKAFVSEGKKEKEPEGTYSSKRHETDGQRIARLAKEKRQAEKKKA